MEAQRATLALLSGRRYLGTAFSSKEAAPELQAPGPLSSISISYCRQAIAQLKTGGVLAEGIALFVVELLVGDALGLDEVEEFAEGAAFLSAALVFVGVA